jgi:hypothetical protein
MGISNHLLIKALNPQLTFLFLGSQYMKGYKNEFKFFRYPSAYPTLYTKLNAPNLQVECFPSRETVDRLKGEMIKNIKNSPLSLSGPRKLSGSPGRRRKPH